MKRRVKREILEKLTEMGEAEQWKKECRREGEIERRERTDEW